MAGGTWAGVNAGIITIHILLLLYGYWLIRWRRDVSRHKRVMITAGIVFLVFLTSFLVRIATNGVTPLGTWAFPVQPRQLQVAHAAIALFTVGLVAATYWHGLRRHDRVHRRIAPWALGLWIFTGAFGIFGYLFYP